MLNMEVTKEFDHIGIKFCVGDKIVVKDRGNDQYFVTEKNGKHIYSCWIKKLYLLCRTNIILHQKDSK